MKSLTNECGFTLVEIMITTVVVSVVLLGFVSASSGIQMQGEAAHQRSMAIQDANQVIEQMRNAAATGTFPGNVTAVFSGDVDEDYSNMPDTADETISVSYADPTADPLDATVTVTYMENGNRQTTATIRTYITQRS